MFVKRTPKGSVQPPAVNIWGNGGPRMRANDIRSLYKVNKCYQLPEIDKGNHFLTNGMHASSALKHMDDTTNQLIVEVGPGPGAITRRLLAQDSLGVLGMEMDTSYNAYLENMQQITQHKFQWVNVDIMNVDEPEVIKQAFPERQWAVPWDRTPMVTAVVNISFSSVHSLIVRYCMDISRRRGLYSLGKVPLRFLTEQKVAERVCAATGTKEFSMLSALVQNYFTTHIDRTLAGESFYPFTTVDCAMLVLRPRELPLVEIDGGALFQFLSFVIKSKHQCSVTKALCCAMPVEVASHICREVGIDETLPMWKLTVVDLCRMASMWVLFLEGSNQKLPDLKF
ncbi:rRNA dimethyltransferase [Perkinsela sp. CCAP 1560/4]|nr:rRNA dimethyltransferase [Perkinsela sp. CCAP 1560/4]|eukprot:KNH08745.1 rRNA dimethyltransferase [Perkinsela sp. CCAP 1560/4]